MLASELNITSENIPLVNCSYGSANVFGLFDQCNIRFLYILTVRVCYTWTKHEHCGDPMSNICLLREIKNGTSSKKDHDLEGWLLTRGILLSFAKIFFCCINTG